MTLKVVICIFTEPSNISPLSCKCWENSDNIGWQRRVLSCEVFVVSVDCWETANSSLLRKTWNEHKIRFEKPDKIHILVIFSVAINSLSLSDHRSRSKGSHETHTHKHTQFPETCAHSPSFRWEFTLKSALCDNLLPLPASPCSIPLKDHI